MLIKSHFILFLFPHFIESNSELTFTTMRSLFSAVHIIQIDCGSTKLNTVKSNQEHVPKAVEAVIFRMHRMYRGKNIARLVIYWLLIAIRDTVLSCTVTRSVFVPTLVRHRILAQTRDNIALEHCRSILAIACFMIQSHLSYVINFLSDVDSKDFRKNGK